MMMILRGNYDPLPIIDGTWQSMIGSVPANFKAIN